MGLEYRRRGSEKLFLINATTAVNLQDTVDQAKVNIPSYEMFADMLLALAIHRGPWPSTQPRLNSAEPAEGIDNACQAAEIPAQQPKPEFYYAALLNSTKNSERCCHLELAPARSFASFTQSVGNWLRSPDVIAYDADMRCLTGS